MEEHAIKRDRGFLVRLVLLLSVAVLLGVILIAGLTSDKVSGCMADGWGGGAQGTGAPQP